MPAFLGLEIGGTKLQVVLGDEKGHISQRRKLMVERGGGAENIRRQIQDTLPELLSCETVQAVAVGFGGPVDWRLGKVSRSHQVEGWSEFDLGAWLHGLAGAPVAVDNDANVAALGEAQHGAGIGFDRVFYVTLGSGIGGGFVMDGHIYHGACPGEAEIGHVRLDRQGTTLESRCSGWAVDARIRELAGREPSSLLGKLIKGGRGGEAKHLATALREHDTPAKRLLAEVAEDLAFGLSHVVHLFHPDIIVLGGGLSGVGEPLRAAVEEALRPFVMEVFRPGMRVVLTALGEDAVPVGAVELAKGVGKLEGRNPKS
jgi:glucokinase